MVQLVFHVIHDGNSKVTATMIENQVAVLNTAYSGRSASLGVKSHIRFNLKNINYIDSATYSANCGDEPYVNDHSLADPTLVNVFTCPDSSYLGWAYLPWSFSAPSFVGNCQQVAQINCMNLRSTYLRVICSKNL